jgi:hypothetical protein
MFGLFPFAMRSLIPVASPFAAAAMIPVYCETSVADGEVWVFAVDGQLNTSNKRTILRSFSTLVAMAISFS